MAVLMIPKGQAQPALAGTVLSGKQAPNFRLMDQWNHPVTLSQFRGRTVILTFMESH
jgi:protein SCO1/2